MVEFGNGFDLCFLLVYISCLHFLFNFDHSKFFVLFLTCSIDLMLFGGGDGGCGGAVSRASRNSERNER